MVLSTRAKIKSYALHWFISVGNDCNLLLGDSMTRQEIIEIATKVYGECDWHESALVHLEAFAKLVAAKEREECAKVCDYLEREMCERTVFYSPEKCAEAIRARGEA
jgi:hypothetical protein